MKTKISTRNRILTFAMVLGVSSLSAVATADFDIVSRHSELTVSSTNLGGAQFSVDSADPALPFNVQVLDSATHEEPSGNINGGTWNGSQQSSMSTDLIRANLSSEVITQQIFGPGIPILDMFNEFEVEFEVSETTEIELGGTMFGTPGVLGADDYVNVRFQYHNGITFLTLYTTTTLDDMNAVFVDTLQPGVLYRLSVESHADAMGAQATASGLSICLRERFSTGDMNQDGVVNLLDVAPFVDALSAGIYDGQADVNCDGLVDLTDVGPFVAILGSN